MNDEQKVTSPGGRILRRVLWVVGGVAVLAAAFAIGALFAPGPSPDETAKPSAPAVPGAPPVTTAPAGTPAPPTDTLPAPDLGADAGARSRKKPAPATAPATTAAPATPTAGELRVDADVPGAIVFFDREYIGQAPVRLSNVTPGRHQLNVSAEGYDGYSEPVDVKPGAAEITVRFKEIRLNESLTVVHKHGMGSCEGRLVADPQGIRYETTNKEDAFSMTFAEVERFEVDYLAKNLRIKRRNGKTWNFTTKTENADPLFVFHRNVDKVRRRVTGAPPEAPKK